MNFFEQQEKARSKTTLLVGLFLLSIVATAFLLNIIIDFAFRGTYVLAHPGELLQFTDRTLIVFCGTLVFILIASLVRILYLGRSGGGKIAQSLGGREITIETKSPLEKRLMNVVEEMSIASGSLMPRVFVMDSEDSINAFAAGHNINDSVVAVTSGTLRKLNRDELQGVVAHEFSHIFNGDMKLNIRLVGIIFGLICIANLGRVLMRSVSYRSSRRKDGAGPVIAAGVGLFIVGSIGVFFGNLIKSMISRQREFLADSSSVQFTRNPMAISGALKKIWADPLHATMANQNVEEYSHFFFGQAFRTSLFSFASHPPLEARIKAIDPNFSTERFQEFELDQVLKSLSEREESNSDHVEESHHISSSPIPKIIPQQEILVGASLLSNEIGNVKSHHLDEAKKINSKVPEIAKSNPAEAVLSLFVTADSGVFEKQKKILEPLYPAAVEIFQKLNSLSRRLRLPILEVSLAKLKSLSHDQRKEFLLVVKALVEADDRTTPDEFILYSICKFSLLDRTESWMGHLTLKGLKKETHLALSFLAYIAQTSSSSAQESFDQGWSFLYGNSSRVLSAREINPLVIEKSFEQLYQLSPRDKGKFLESCLRIATHDGKVQAKEWECLRSIGLALDCPIPLTS